VFGGEVKDPRSVEFVDVDSLDIVGIYPNPTSPIRDAAQNFSGAK